MRNLSASLKFSHVYAVVHLGHQPTPLKLRSHVLVMDFQASAM